MGNACGGSVNTGWGAETATAAAVSPQSSYFSEASSSLRVSTSITASMRSSHAEMGKLKSFDIKFSRVSRAEARSTKSCVLSADEQTLLRESWRAVVATSGSLQLVGLRIFANVFMRNRRLRQAFGVERTDNAAQLPPEHPFRRHAFIFANMLDLTLRNTDQLELHITPTLIAYGQRHFNKPAASFSAQNAALFCCAIVEFVVETLDDRGAQHKAYRLELKRAWTHIVQYMLDKLKQGYDFEAAHYRGRLRLGRLLGCASSD